MTQFDTFTANGWTVKVQPMGILWGASAAHNGRGVVTVLARKSKAEAVDAIRKVMQEEEGSA